MAVTDFTFVSRSLTARTFSTVTTMLTVAVAVVQRRQELAHRQIAGATEDDQVERIDRDELRHSGSLTEDSEILLQKRPIDSEILSILRFFL